MRNKSVLLLCVIAVVTICHAGTIPCMADDYYVSPSGNDSNPGSKALPWRTIGKAAKTLVAGDTVYIRAGTYKEQVKPANSGNAGSYITYSAYPGETATIDGNGMKLQNHTGLFHISNRKYLKVQGLRVINAGPHDNVSGILVNESSHVIIKGNYTYNTASSGIGVWDSDNIIIDGNEVELACNDGEQECLTVAVTDTFEIKNNYVHHGGPGSIGGEGLDAKDGSSNGKIFNNHIHDMNRLGIYVDAWDKHTYNIEVFSNIVHDCTEDGFALAAENGGLLDNVRVYNNIAYDNRYNGLTIASWGVRGAKHPMKDLYVVNNTFYSNGCKEWGGGISIENGNVNGLVVRNNILSQNYWFQMQSEVPIGGFNIDHNLIDGYREYDDELRGGNHVQGDPRFVNPSENNLRLQAGSPAINTGSGTDAPEKDSDYGNRPASGGYDIGAFEYGSKNDIKTPKKLKAKARKRQRVKLRWRDKSKNETGFNIERREDGEGVWRVVAEADANSRKHIDAGLKPAASYSYRVRAFNNSGYSFYSNVAVVTTK